jgi:hypothetical protein
VVALERRIRDLEMAVATDAAEAERRIRHLEMAAATDAGEAPVPIRTKLEPLSHCLHCGVEVARGPRHCGSCNAAVPGAGHPVTLYEVRPGDGTLLSSNQRRQPLASAQLRAALFSRVRLATEEPPPWRFRNALADNGWPFSLISA